MQNITKGPLIEAVNTRSEVWVDGAHNPHAARALFDALQSLNSKAPLELVMVIGQLKTKDAKAFFEILKPLAPKIYTVSIDNPNAYSAHELADIAQGVGLNTVCANLPIDALRKTVDNPCRVVIAGSLYLAAEVLGMSPLTYPD
jgi:dihydrofolate synthase/folylpolyglutamate synthase